QVSSTTRRVFPLNSLTESIRPRANRGQERHLSPFREAKSYGTACAAISPAGCTRSLARHSWCMARKIQPLLLPMRSEPTRSSQTQHATACRSAGIGLKERNRRNLTASWGTSWTIEMSREEDSFNFLLAGSRAERLIHSFIHSFRPIDCSLKLSLFQWSFFILNDEAFGLCYKPPAFFSQIFCDPLCCIANNTHQKPKSDTLIFRLKSRINCNYSHILKRVIR